VSSYATADNCTVRVLFGSNSLAFEFGSRTAANQLHAAAAVDRRDRQTDGGTKPERYTDSASHIMPVASMQTYGLPLYLVNGLSKSTQLILLESLTTLESGCKINIITDAGIDPTIEDSGSFSLQVVLQFKYGSVRTVSQFGSFRVRFNSHHYCCCCCCFCK